MAMNTSSGGKKGAIAPAMNVTPLVDVVLVLLIIFMIVTPLLSAGFHATMPTGNHLDKDAEKEVTALVEKLLAERAPGTAR